MGTQNPGPATDDLAASTPDGRALLAFSQRNKLDYRYLAGLFYRETNQTLHPNQEGGNAAKGHAGLIQFGPAEKKRYGYRPDMSFADQLAPDGPVEKYLKERFSWDGKELGEHTTPAELCAAVLAGRPHLIFNRDVNGSSYDVVHSGRLKSYAEDACAKLGIPYDKNKPFATTPSEDALALDEMGHRSAPASKAIDVPMGHHGSNGNTQRRRDHRYYQVQGHDNHHTAGFHSGGMGRKPGHIKHHRHEI